MGSKQAENSELKEAFRQLADTFTKNVNIDGVTDLLYSNGVLSLDDVDSLKFVDTRIEKARHLFAHLLIGTHPKAFILLREALLNDYKWIVDEIDNISSVTESSNSANTNNRAQEKDVLSTDELKKILQQLKEKFVDNVDADRIIDSLLQRGVITDNDYYKLSQPRQTTKQKTRLLYDILQRSVQADNFVSLKHSLSEEYGYLDLEIDSLYLNSKRSRYTGPPKRWINLQMLNQGGRNRVWICRDDDKNYVLAVKEIYFPERNSESQKDAFEPVLTEIAILGHLNHPNIVQYYGHKWKDAQLNLFMEYMAGGSLSALIEQQGVLSEAVTRKYAQQILRGLSYIHGQNIVHRDIKGQNVLVNGDYTVVKLVDFGLSKMMGGRTRTATTAGRGTDCYMSPEILEHGMYSVKADIWSFGCTVVEMITGHPPFHDFKGSVAIAIFKGSSPMPENIDVDVKKFLSRCFETNPADRASALQLLDDPFIDALLPDDQLLEAMKTLAAKMPSAASTDISANNRIAVTTTSPSTLPRNIEQADCSPDLPANGTAASTTQCVLPQLRERTTPLHVIPSVDGREVQGVTVLNGQLFVARPKWIEIYNTTSYTQHQQQQQQQQRQQQQPEQQPRINISGLSDVGIVGMAGCAANNCLYVSDWKGQAVYKVDLSAGNKATKCRVDGGPWGLSVTSANSLLITCRNKDSIRECKANGSRIREIKLQSDVTDPWHAIQLTSGQLAGQFVVCHGGYPSHRVCVVNGDGNVIVSYGNNRGSAAGQLNVPIHLTVDRNGFVFIADRGNDRIVVLTPSLVWSRDMYVAVDGGLKEPSRLFIDESRDQMFIGDCGGRILVLNLVE